MQKPRKFTLTGLLYAWLVEEEGFEPPEPHGSTVFKTAAIDHSATPLKHLPLRLGALGLQI